MIKICDICSKNIKFWNFKENINVENNRYFLCKNCWELYYAFKVKEDGEKIKNKDDFKKITNFNFDNKLRIIIENSEYEKFKKSVKNGLKIKEENTVFGKLKKI